MNLEKLILGTIIALSSIGCTTYRVIKRPPKPVPIPVTKNIVEEVPAALKNYRQIRYASGVYALYDTTFFTPEPQLKEEEKAKEIEERISYINSRVIIENSGRELDKDKLSSKTLPINLPKDKKTAISTLEECLNAKETTNINFYRALCTVASGRANGYGIIIGENYAITSAYLIYPTALSRELKLDQKVEISVLEEIKEKEEGQIDYATVLTLNPLADIALLEIINPKQKRNWRIPILKSKKIEEVTLYTDSTLNSLESDAKLKENELAWRLSNKELKTAQALNFSLITVKTPFNLVGTGVYNTKGLVGIIASKPEVESERINTLVTNSNLIREFLKDYINFLRSGSNNLESITKFSQKLSKTEPEINIPTKADTTSKEEPKTDIMNYVLFTYLALLSACAGKYVYDRYNEEKPEEKEKLIGNIAARLNEVEAWIKEENKATPKLPATIVESRNSAVTMYGFEKTSEEKEDIARFKGHFINLLEESAKENLKLPKAVIEFYKQMNIPYKSNKLLKLQKERKKRLAPLEVARIERLTKLLDLDKI